jgi:predicted DCC family thiol-disulfide oxidoreductase YuxK
MKKKSEAKQICSILYYDGECPICSHEMLRLAELKSDELELRDIHAEGEPLPLPKETLLAELHVKNEHGEWLTGLEANVAAWQHTRFRKLASMLLWPGINWFARLGYRLWLVWYQRARQRRLAAKPKPPTQTTSRTKLNR